VLGQLEQRSAGFDFTVLAGRTGSAKSRLLQALAAAGAQVLDLEALARHRGSVLGLVPGEVQPSQKAFETALWQALGSLDRARPVFVESESRTIGRLRLPETLLQGMRAARVVQVQMPLEARLAFLMDDYRHFVLDTAAFGERLAALDSRGHLVELGGEARAWGTRADGTRWRVAVPAAAGGARELAPDRAIAFSTAIPGRTPIDPRTSLPAPSTVGIVSAEAATCAVADARAVAAALGWSTPD
jgi:hypothetical protein